MQQAKGWRRMVAWALVGLLDAGAMGDAGVGAEAEGGGEAKADRWGDCGLAIGEAHAKNALN